MLDYRLSKQELAELRAAHRRALNVREAYRINAVILLGNGRTVADVTDALLIDPDTVRSYFKRYKKGGTEELLRMNYVGSEALLDAVQPKMIVVADSEFPATRRASRELKDRLAGRKTPVIYTRTAGAVTILAGSEGWELRTMDGQKFKNR